MKIHRRKERQSAVSAELEEGSEGIKFPKKSAIFLTSQWILTIAIGLPLSYATGKNLTDFGEWLGTLTTPNLGWMLYYFGWFLLIVGNLASYLVLIAYGLDRLESYVQRKELEESQNF